LISPGAGVTPLLLPRRRLAPALQAVARAGIERTVVFPVFHSDDAIANRAFARIVALARGRLCGLAFVHPQRDAGRVRLMMSEAVEQLGFRGIKVDRHDGGVTREICDAARGIGLPVLYDVIGETETVGLLAGEYPDVSFIIPHRGSFADEWRAEIDMIGLLIRHPNGFTDTSAVRRFDLVEEPARAGGLGRCCSAATALGFTPASNSPRSGCCACGRTTSAVCCDTVPHS
jgi:hypothetical protein